MKMDGGKMAEIFDKVETKMVQATPDTTTGKLPTHARSSRYISSRSQCPSGGTRSRSGMSRSRR